jgi:uncharacterized protein
LKITASAVSLNVADPTASAAFVREHLGFEEEMADEGFVSLKREGRRLQPGLPSHRACDLQARGDAGSLRGRALGRVRGRGHRRRVRDEGVDITTPIETEPWGERFFQMSDANGVVANYLAAAGLVGRARGHTYNGSLASGSPGDFVQQMQIYGVSFDMVGKQPIVLLKTVDGNKFLPIWIGHPEAAAILMKLQGASTPRPMTHDLLSDLLEQMDAKCERVSVTELRDNTFYASITISVNGSELEIDSRPSDALALAVRVSAPIFAAEDVIEESAIEFEHEVEDTEEVVEKFKDFLDEVTPEDFAQGSD